MNNEKKQERPANDNRAKVLFLAQAGVIAALYVVLTIFINAFNLASGAIQVRISEALCILAIFTPAAVPGLAIGCLLSNIFTGCILWDIIFGTCATLVGAFFSYKLRSHKFLATLPPVVANMIVVPFVLYYGYGLSAAWIVGGVDLSIPFYMVTVGAGEVISVCVLGTLLRKALEPVSKYIFKAD